MIRLFLTDDHQIVLDGLAAFLEKENHMEIVGTALNGEDTLERLALQPVDVLVLDIGMPGIDGIETARQIKKRYPQTRIVLLTMHSEGRMIFNAMRYGLHGYVLKEKSKECLVAAIYAVMNKQTYFPPDVTRLIEGMDEEDEIKLTKREEEILRILAGTPSFSAADIGKKIFIAPTTVEKHLQNIRKKLNIHKGTELIKYALDRGIV